MALDVRLSSKEVMMPDESTEMNELRALKAAGQISSDLYERRRLAIIDRHERLRKIDASHENRAIDQRGAMSLQSNARGHRSIGIKSTLILTAGIVLAVAMILSMEGVGIKGPNIDKVWARVQLVETWNYPDAGVSALAISHDGTQLAVGSEKGTIVIASASTEQITVLLEIEEGEKSIDAIDFSPDGDQFAAGGRDKVLRVYDIVDYSETQIFESHFDTLASLEFSPTGNFIATGSTDGEARIWSLSQSDPLLRLKEHYDAVLSVDISPNGQMIATGAADKTVGVWSMTDGELNMTLSGHEDKVNAVSFSPNGRWILSGGTDSVAMLWSAASGQLQQIFSGHLGPVLDVAWSPDSQTVATASEDKSIKLWSVKSGELLSTLSEHDAAVTSLAFSPDEKTLFSGSLDNSIKRWMLP